MDYRWKVTNTGRRSPGTCVPMVAQILRRNVDVVKSMLASAAARPGFNPTGDAMHHRSRHRSLFRAIFPTRRAMMSRSDSSAGLLQPSGDALGGVSLLACRLAL